MSRWYWLCPGLAVGVAAALFILWGWTWWTAILGALLLVCPALMIWGAAFLRRQLDSPAEAAPATSGMTMGWAAPIYDWYCPKLGLGAKFRTATLELAAIRPGERVLEVGCGTGVLTRLAAGRVGPAGEAVGIDPAPAMIAVARREAAGSTASFRLAAIEALPFADASFDLVLSSLMLHHLPPAAKARGLQEVFRVLKPGGRLLVVDLDRPANPLWWLLFWPWLLVAMTAPNLRGEIPAYLGRAGFGPVARRGRWLQLLSFWSAEKGGAA